MNDDPRLTPKLPALLVGIIAIMGGLIAGNRGLRNAGIALVLIGLAFVIYSSTIKEWCVAHAQGWGGGTPWGEVELGAPLGDCLKEKGWLEF